MTERQDGVPTWPEAPPSAPWPAPEPAGPPPISTPPAPPEPRQWHPAEPAPAEPAPAGRAPATYPQPGYAQPEYAQPQPEYAQPQPEYAQPQPEYAQPQPEYAQREYAQPQPGYAQPGHPAAAHPQPVPPQPEYPQPGYQAPPPAVRQRAPGRAATVLRWLTFGLTIVLLAVAVTQAVFLVKLSDRADRQADELRATNAELDDTRARLDALGKRVAGVEDRTKGTLNSAAVAKKVLPSVYRVRAGAAAGTAFAFGTPPGGSGTLLVTNFHVVEDVVRSGTRRATVERTGEQLQAQIVKLDERRDLAVLQVSKKLPVLTPAKAPVQPGEPVVVVGAPLGLADTVTTGVVSAVRANVPGLDSPVIQFDAAISPGNSGGPVSNAEGQVVGVAQAKIIRENAEGLALAIPIAEVCDGLIDC